MNKIASFIFLDIIKNRIVIIYTFFLALMSWGVFSLEDNSSKGLLTLLNIILLIVPLVSVIFSTIYLYNSSEFIELLLCQPIPRLKLWCSIYLGLVVALLLSFLVGSGIPLLLFAPLEIGAIMIIGGIFISMIFVSIAFLSAIFSRDKAKGIGISIMLWLFFAVLFDSLILFLLFQFAEYPIENLMVIVSALNPIDLSRILILLQLDVSAMLGYTGAIFKDFFGSSKGGVLSILILVIWVFVPFYISARRFKRKDL